MFEDEYLKFWQECLIWKYRDIKCVTGDRVWRNRVSC